MNINFTLILQIISFLILLGLLKKYLYKPFMKYLEDRAKEASNILGSARSAEEKAKEYAEQTRKTLDQAKNDALRLKDETRRIADKERLDTINRSKTEARRIVEEAKKEIKKAESEASKKIKTSIADISMEVARKILGREVKKDDHSKLIDESLREIGSG